MLDWVLLALTEEEGSHISRYRWLETIVGRHYPSSCLFASQRSDVRIMPFRYDITEAQWIVRMFSELSRTCTQRGICSMKCFKNRFCKLMESFCRLDGKA